MKKKHVLPAILVFLTVQAFCQSGQPLRVEIPVKSGTNPFNHITFGDKGLCLFYPTSNDVGKDSVSWSFVMHDRNLKEQWKQLIPLHEDVNYIKGFSQNNAIYLLFHDTQRNTDGNIHVLMIIPHLQLITEHRSSIPDKAEVVDFELLNDFALLGYNLRKGKPGLIGFSLVSGEKRTFDFSLEDNALLLDVLSDTIYKDVYAVYKVQPSASKNRLMVNQYNSSSALRRSISFENVQEKKILNSAQLVITAEGKGFVAGAYGSGARNRRNYDYYNDYYNYYYYNSFYRRQLNQNINQDNTPVTDGYYTAAFSPSGEGSILYHNFIDFTDMQKYISDPEAIRTRRKADKRANPEASGVENDKEYSLDYRMLIHPLISSKGNYLLLAEAYVPEYHTMTQMVYDYYGRAMPSTYSVFDGFRYKGAFIASFDSSGRMEWNNGMEMRDILTSFLNRKMNFYFDGDNEIILFYNANSKIAFKTINKEKVLEGTALTPIAPKRLTDQPVSEYLGSIEYWYGNYFLAVGYETLRNNALDENKRNVFYLNKMAFR